MKLVCLFLLIAVPAGASVSDSNQKTTVKYKGPKEVDFDQTVIEGTIKRPELSVVTGDAADGSNGLLRLRENFVDRFTAEAGEEMP